MGGDSANGLAHPRSRCLVPTLLPEGGNLSLSLSASIADTAEKNFSGKCCSKERSVGSSCITTRNETIHRWRKKSFDSNSQSSSNWANGAVAKDSVDDCATIAAKPLEKCVCEFGDITGERQKPNFHRMHARRQWNIDPPIHAELKLPAVALMPSSHAKGNSRPTTQRYQIACARESYDEIPAQESWRKCLLGRK